MKVVSLILTFALLVSMIIVPSISTSASSDPGTLGEGPGEVETKATSITIKGGQEIRGKKYDVIRIFDATLSDNKILDDDGNPTGRYTIIYTIPDKPADMESKIKDNLDGINGIDKDSLTTVTDIVEAIEKLNEDQLQEFAKKMYTALKDDSTAYKGSITMPDTDGDTLSETLSDVPYGYYLVADTSSNESDEVVSAFGLTSTDPTATIEEKTSQPTLQKTVEYESGDKNGSSANVGDTVNYKLESMVPDTKYYDTYTYKITDTLSKGLKFNNDVKIYVDAPNEESGTLVYDGSTKIANATVTHTTTADGSTPDTVTIEITNMKDSTMQVYKGKKLYITYSATITTHAVDTDVVNNKAKLTYSNDPTAESNHTKDTPDDTVKTYLFDLEIMKHDAENYKAHQTHPESNPHKDLPGAQFVLYRKAADGSKEYLKLDTTTNTAGKTLPANLEDLMKVATPTWKVAAKDAWAKTKEEATTVVTGSDSKFLIKGLAEGTYYLEEVVAPDGYNRLKQPVKFQIDATIDETSGELTKTELKVANNDGINQSTADPALSSGTALDSNKTAKIDVLNGEGHELPSTGGMGTTLIYTLGGALVVIAGVLLITKKRMSATR